MPESLPARSPQWEMGLFTDWVVENWPKATIAPVEAGALALAPGGMLSEVGSPAAPEVDRPEDSV